MYHDRQQRLTRTTTGVRGTWKQFNEYMHKRMRGLVLYVRRTARDGPKSRGIEKYTRATRLAALGRLLEGDGLLLAHGGDDSDKEILAVLKGSRDFRSDVTVRDLDVVLGVAILVHQVEETIVDIDLMRSSSGVSAIKMLLKVQG